MNGFAAELTEAQAAKLEATEGVLSVEKAEPLEVATSNTPDFLGLTKPKNQGGLWARLVARARAPGTRVPARTSSSASSTPATGRSTELRRPRQGQQGQEPATRTRPRLERHRAKAARQFPANTCNNKVLGAQWFADGIGPLPEWEYASPRDFGGHGSHTASEAGGNFSVQATG